jgi:hypothetical protein
MSLELLAIAETRNDNSKKSSRAAVINRDMAVNQRHSPEKPECRAGFVVGQKFHVLSGVARALF